MIFAESNNFDAFLASNCKTPPNPECNLSLGSPESWNLSKERFISLNDPKLFLSNILPSSAIQYGLYFSVCVTRINPWDFRFEGILQLEAKKASKVFDSALIISELPDSFGYHTVHSERIDAKMLEKMIIEEQKAKDYLEEKYVQARW